MPTGTLGSHLGQKGEFDMPTCELGRRANRLIMDVL